MLACTSVTASHVPYVRVLTDSFLKHHPDGRVAALIVDDDAGGRWSGERFEALRPADVGIEPREAMRMRMLYEAGAYACAMKPRVLRHLVERHGSVLYLDGDCLVYDDLSELTSLARRRGVVLTAHSLTPAPLDSPEPAELSFLRWGAFNAGVLAVGRDGLPFLDWWAERCARHGQAPALATTPNDQLWLSLVPALFERHHVLRDPGVNVSGWNLHARDVEWDGERPTIEGRPLRCFHFCGHFDPADPLAYRPDAGRPEQGAPIAERPGAARVCEQYARLLAAAGFADEGGAYPFATLPDDTPVTPLMRDLYRRELMAAELGRRPEPPIPFADPARFLAWLREPTAGAVSRYLVALRATRPDVAAAFPEVPGRDEAGFLAWVGAAITRGEVTVPDALRPA